MACESTTLRKGSPWQEDHSGGCFAELLREMYRIPI